MKVDLRKGQSVARKSRGKKPGHERKQVNPLVALIVIVIVLAIVCLLGSRALQPPRVPPGGPDPVSGEYSSPLARTR